MHISLATYGLLFAAVVFEAMGTSFLEKSEGMSRFAFLTLALASYAASFVLGSLILKTMPMGVMYAVWCGVGIILVGVIGFAVNKQSLDAPTLLGMGLIAAGVVIIYMYSKSVTS